MRPLEEAVDTALACGANQRRAELLIAGFVMSLDPPKRVLEIGNAFGGTLMLWSLLATDDAQVMGIDTDHSQLGPAFSVQQGQELHLHEGRSDSPEAFKAALDFFRGPVDLLFIDGDHSYDCVRGDFETYSPLVGAGGLIGFHDITGPMADVAQYWDELRRSYREHVAIQAEPVHHMGIGLLRKR